MLSEQEKQELKAMAASDQLRREFQWLSESSRALEASLSPDDFVRFLSLMARLCPTPPPARPFVPYTNARL